MVQATRTTLSTFGAIVGVAGLEHGVGEILQGNVAPNGFVIESWPDVQAYEVLVGEPAMTIIPNLLLSGVLTIILSIILTIWAVMHIEKKNGGRILILLSFILLLVGGGFGPPIIGFILGTAGTKMKSPPDWKAGRAILARLWPFLFVAGIIGYLSLWPGLVILSQFITAEALPTAHLTLFSFATLVLAILSGFAYDTESKDNIVVEN